MALTDVGKVDTFLGSIESGNYATNQKEFAIDAAVAEIEQYTGRVFDSAEYIGWYDGSGGTEYITEQYPITAVYRVATLSEYSIRIQNTTQPKYTVSVTPDSSMTLSFGSTRSTLTLSDYATMALLATAIINLGNGWTATVLVEDTPAHLRPSVQAGNTVDILEFESPDDDTDIIIREPASGIMYSSFGFPQGFSSVFIDYQAGYTTIPKDLERVATALAVDYLRDAGVDNNMKSEKFSDYTYTRAERTESFISNYKSVLAKYARL